VATRNFDIHVKILDLIAENDKVVVRNRSTGTEAATGKNVNFPEWLSGGSRNGNWWIAGRS
jgi:hypothetical protein